MTRCPRCGGRMFREVENYDGRRAAEVVLRCILCGHEVEVLSPPLARPRAYPDELSRRVEAMLNRPRVETRGRKPKGA